MYQFQVLKETDRIRWLNLGGNPLGDLGGMAIILTLNYQICAREILLHGCTYAVAAKQPKVANKPRTKNTTAVGHPPAASTEQTGGSSAADPIPTMRQLTSITYPTGSVVSLSTGSDCCY